jgi:hypothetical protein
MSTVPPITDASTGLPEGAVPSAEYANAMLNAQHTDPTPAPVVPHSANKRPDHVPEKFWDPVKGEARWDDLAKSYAELEKMRGAPKPETPPVEAPADSAATGTKIERPAEPAQAPLASLLETVTTSYSAEGKFSDDNIAALEAAGIPKSMVETYAAGLAALETVNLQAVHAAAGGAEAFQSAQAWAAQALSDADLDYFNGNIDNPANRTQAVEWLMAKYSAARPSEGNLVVDTNSTSPTGDVFTNQSQVTAAMSSDQYRQDPAFRKAVGEKLIRSKRAGSLSVGAEMFSRSR